MKYVVDKKWLLEHMQDEDVVIVDCRFDLANPAIGEKLYQESHIEGAYYFDLHKQLSAPVSTHGGRHPLPDMKDFQSKIEASGINPSKTVIAYDSGISQYASRFWWLLSYIGHEKIYVLNEGFNGWIEAGYPVTQEIPKKQGTSYEIKLQEDMLASYTEVKDIVDNKKKLPILIDSRAQERYLGKVEPLDRVAGHIPGAINKFFEEGLSKGIFKNSEEQKKRFAELNTEDPIIVYCGSGVTATPNYIALKMAGFQNVKLYAGSYSDWVSYEENPVEKEDSSI